MISLGKTSAVCMLCAGGSVVSLSGVYFVVLDQNEEIKVAINNDLSPAIGDVVTTPKSSTSRSFNSGLSLFKAYSSVSFLPVASMVVFKHDPVMKKVINKVKEIPDSKILALSYKAKSGETGEYTLDVAYDETSPLSTLDKVFENFSSSQCSQSLDYVNLVYESNKNRIVDTENLEVSICQNLSVADHIFGYGKYQENFNQNKSYPPALKILEKIKEITVSRNASKNLKIYYEKTDGSNSTHNFNDINQLIQKVKELEAYRSSLSKVEVTIADKQIYSGRELIQILENS